MPKRTPIAFPGSLLARRFLASAVLAGWLLLAATAEAQQPAAGRLPAAESQDTSGPFEPGKGIVAARGPLGEFSFGIFGYVRYLNQKALNDAYADSFGRTFPLDRRQDIQLNRLQINFRGWLFDEAFKYLVYGWTQNTSQGDDAQVVIGGTLSYRFADAFTLTGGIFSIPSTRSTNQTFPNWLKVDHRTMADEYFRGSYTTGIMANGTVVEGLAYKVALANNLSQLGVSAAELDDGLNTVSAVLAWMPTTGEFGPGSGFGDYEHHDELATLFGIQFTHSREDAQGQPEVDDFENSQLRLSDGTLIFSPDPFVTGGNIRKATYDMLDLNAGFKRKGWSLEGEYYFRWLHDFDVIGSIPVTEVFDHGFQVQGSVMLMPNVLQAYLAGSKVFGDYGDPWDLGIGLTLYPFARKQVRTTFQALYNEQSPAGGNAVPFPVGADGWVYTLDTGVWF